MVILDKLLQLIDVANRPKEIKIEIKIYLKLTDWYQMLQSNRIITAETAMNTVLFPFQDH